MKYTQSILRGLIVLLVALSPLALADTGPSTGTMSLLHVRIVRLSFVQGDVSLKRPSEADWSAATVNTPIQEGFSVATSPDSFAEVEFENGSTARLGQGSQVDFTQLALTPQGDKINRLALSKGYATFHFTPEHHDQYEVDANGVTITVRGKAEFRTNYSGDSLRVEVFDGEVQAAHDGKTEELGKNRVLTYDPNAVEAMATSSGLQKDSWDKWTQARDEQAILATNDESVSLNGSLYGWGDLDTYGDWSYFPGHGYGWAPYEPAGWAPYSSGMFGYYPEWGFTWISAEPWGWLPYHNGFWNYDASMGWFWMPGPLEDWNPAMVNWYEGQDWVGWMPMGSGGAGACSITVPGCLTAVAPTVLETGTPLRPGSPLVIHPGGGLTGATRIGSPRIVDGAGRPVSALAVAAARTQAARTIAPAAVSGETAMHAAPASVVMGHSISADAFLSHHGLFSGPQAIHAQLGRTMGGTFPTVVAHNGQVMPDSRYRAPGAQGNAAPRMPTVMAHAPENGGASAAIGPRGGISPVAASSSAGASSMAAERGASATSAAQSAPSASAASAGGARTTASAPASSSSSSSPSGAHR